VKFTVVTILPELIEPALAAGVVGRAREAGIIEVDTVNPRDFTRDRHRTVDDTPYGGGPGMVMKAEPLLAAIAKASEPRERSSASASAATAAPDLGTDTPSDAPIDPLARVEDAVAKVESMIGGIAGQAGPLTSARRLEEVASTVAEAEATLAAVETAIGHTPLPEVEPPSSADATAADRAAAANEPNLIAPPSPSDAPSTSELSRSSPATPTDSPSGARSAAGSTMAPPPVTPRVHRILLSPSGAPLTQARVRELAARDHLVLVCGRYEGVDQRVIDLAIDEELSIGDYVLSGGELGALVLIDACARLVPGVLGEPTSADDESFSAGLLEYPQYTRPPELATAAIPEPLRERTATEPAHAPARAAQPRVELGVPRVLQSGNHAAISAWRREQAMRRTVARRPDLWRAFRPTKADRKLLPPLGARTHLALVHHPIVDRVGTVITTALTNFDIHDLARSTMTYGLAGYHIVTPVTSQREKAEHIASMWMASEQGEHRAQALRLIRTAASVEDVIAELTAEHGGRPPTVVATSARAESFPDAARCTSSELVAEASVDPAPVLLLLGTGWGLADALIPSVSRVLAPIEGASEWNHLSVRSAGAIILDRLFGRPA